MDLLFFFFFPNLGRKNVFIQSLEKKCSLTKNLQKKINGAYSVHINSSLESNNRHSLHLFRKFTSK